MTVDLNFNSTSKHRDAVAGLAFSDAVNKLIDIGIQSEVEEERAFNVSPSLIGEECDRRIQFTITGVPQAHPPKLRRIFKRGHILEDVVAGWVITAGFHLSVLGDDGKQHGYQIGGGNIRGRLDGILEAGPKIEGLSYRAVWECKVLGSKGWANLKKNGVQAAYPKYAVQISQYQTYMDLQHPSVLTALNADTMELHHELVPFSPDMAQKYSDRSVDIMLAVNARQLLPRASGDPDHFTCRFCDFKDHCWSDGGLGPKRPSL